MHLHRLVLAQVLLLASSSYCSILLAMQPQQISQLQGRADVDPSECTYTPVSNVGMVCGTSGTLKSPQPLRAPTRAANQNLCRDQCFRTSECISYSYTASQKGKQCQLYSQTLKAQGFKSSSSSSTVFWNRKCFKMTCPACPRGQTMCADGCKNLDTDNDNCVQCGIPCTGGSHCAGAINGCLCPPGAEYCNGWCNDYQSDKWNCGECGYDCGDIEGAGCVNGQCTYVGP